MRKDTPWYLRPFRGLLDHPTYFAVSRRGVSGALFIGIFIGLMPVPGQTVIALLAALLLRVNLPVAGLAVWVTNPLTIVPVFVFEYRLGARLLGVPPGPFDPQLSDGWFSSGLAGIWKPLLLGGSVVATLTAAAAYLLINFVWRVSTTNRYRRRHQRISRD